jgi:hypothetical protein
VQAYDSLPKAESLRLLPDEPDRAHIISTLFGASLAFTSQTASFMSATTVMLAIPGPLSFYIVARSLVPRCKAALSSRSTLPRVDSMSRTQRIIDGGGQVLLGPQVTLGGQNRRMTQ